MTALRPSAPGAAPCGVRIDQTHEGPVLTVQVVPRARRAGVVGVHGDALKLAVHAPPVEGAANAAVLAALSEWAGVSRSSLRLVSGASARRKRILFTALTVADLWDRLRVVAESEV